MKFLFLDGKFVPKGASIIISPRFLGRDPKTFEDPDEFKPERFLDEKTTANAFSYVPFSAGPRNCIGQKFAMLELKTIIAKVLRKFEVSVGENYEPVLVSEMILRPANGIILKMTPRVYA